MREKEREIKSFKQKREDSREIIYREIIYREKRQRQESETVKKIIYMCMCGER